MSFNEALRKLREVIGESQQSFANQLGISIRGLANYEHDRIPGLLILARLQKFADRPDLPAKVKKAIENQYLQELKKGIGLHEGITSFAFTHEEGRASGLSFQLLRTPEEYAYAVAFQNGLLALRGDEAQRETARKVLHAMYEALLSPEDRLFFDVNVLGAKK